MDGVLFLLRNLVLEMDEILEDIYVEIKEERVYNQIDSNRVLFFLRNLVLEMDEILEDIYVKIKEERAYNKIDSNTDDGFRFGRRIEVFKSKTWRSLWLPMSRGDDLSIVDDTIITLLIAEEYDTHDLFYKKLVTALAWSMQTERKLCLVDKFYRKLEFKDGTKYGPAQWKLIHSPFGNLRQMWKIRVLGTGSKQELGSDKIVHQEYSRKKSKWDMQEEHSTLLIVPKRDFEGCSKGQSALHIAASAGRNLLTNLIARSCGIQVLKLMGTNTENKLSGMYDKESFLPIHIDQVLDGKSMPKGPMFGLGDERKKPRKRVSSSLVICHIIFIYLWPLLVVTPSIQKQRGPASIGASLLELFGFMVFVWAVAVMILVDAKFTRTRSSVFLFWVIAILLHARSDDSISKLYLPLFGIFFITWYVLCSSKSNNRT